MKERMVLYSRIYYGILDYFVRGGGSYSPQPPTGFRRNNMPSASYKSKYPVKSLVKALSILDVLAEQPSGYGITDLSARLKMGKSTVHRLLATLKEEGYVAIHPANSRYILGGRIAKLGQQLSQQHPLLTFAPPTIQSLTREYNETVNLAILEKTEVVYIAGEECSEMLRSHFLLGYRAPAHATAMGKMCLSDLSSDEIRLRYKGIKRLSLVGPRTIGTLERLLDELSSVRKLGVSYDNEESGSGVYCIAVPIRDFSGRCAAAISFSMPKQRMTPERRSILKSALLMASADLSRMLGFVSDKQQTTHRLKSVIK